MGRILEHWRVPLSVLFAMALIIGAYLLARGIQSPPIAEASTETALLKAIANRDSDNDGLPDWEEALYGTDSHNADSFNLGMTDSEAVAKGLVVPKAITDMPIATSTPNADGSIDYGASGVKSPTDNTLTDAFAKSFFTLYVTAKQENGGNDLTSDQTSALADQAMNQFIQGIAPTSDFKSAADISISGTGSDALRAFAIAAEAVAQKNTSNATMSELQYLQDIVQKNDSTAVERLSSIAKAYRGSAAGLAALPVPQELATADLSLINSLMRVSGIIDDFSRVNTDPLTAMLALQQYVSASQELGQAFADVADTYTAAGVVLPKGTPGASFVNVIADMKARQMQQAAIKNL